jgi:hypothetical protein
MPIMFLLSNGKLVKTFDEMVEFNEAILFGFDS